MFFVVLCVVCCLILSQSSLEIVVLCCLLWFSVHMHFASWLLSSYLVCFFPMFVLLDVPFTLGSHGFVQFRVLYWFLCLVSFLEHGLFKSTVCCNVIIYDVVLKICVLPTVHKPARWVLLLLLLLLLPTSTTNYTSASTSIFLILIMMSDNN